MAYIGLSTGIKLIYIFIAFLFFIFCVFKISKIRYRIRKKKEELKKKRKKTTFKLEGLYIEGTIFSALAVFAMTFVIFMIIYGQLFAPTFPHDGCVSIPQSSYPDLNLSEFQKINQSYVGEVYGLNAYLMEDAVLINISENYTLYNMTLSLDNTSVNLIAELPELCYGGLSDSEIIHIKCNYSEGALIDGLFIVENFSDLIIFREEAYFPTGCIPPRPFMTDILIILFALFVIWTIIHFGFGGAKDFFRALSLK